MNVYYLDRERSKNKDVKSRDSTEYITPFDFFFWPVKCIKTKKIDIELHLIPRLETTISLSGTNLNTNTFFD